jgi:hypothetical protein
MLRTRSRHPDCVRIGKRLYQHCDELFPFLDDPAVPADNNGTERDLRSLAAVRSDGGTHRADWSAAAFARLKSVIVTGMKNQVRFIQYGIDVVRAQLRGERLPLPLAAIPDPRSRRAGINRPQPPGTLSTLMCWASMAHPRPSTGSGPLSISPDLPDLPCTASLTRLRSSRAGHASSVTQAQ